MCLYFITSGVTVRVFQRDSKHSSVMTMDALASVHVLITLTLALLLTFVNMPTQRMPNNLSHLQGCPRGGITFMLFWLLTQIC